MNAQIWQEACEWCVEFRTGELDESARRAFHAWLQQSTQHVGAYLQVTALWSEGGAPQVGQQWTPESLIAAAAADEGHVVTLESVLPVKEKLAARPDVRWKVLAVAASVFLAALSLCGWLLMQRGIYITGIGEQRFLALPDGSTLNLNSRSRVRLRYSEQERVVELLEGQALFEVAKNPARPFVVVSGNTRVRAVGTQFDVYRKHADTIVTVVEGRVAVQRKDGSGAPEAGVRATEVPGSRTDVSPTSRLDKAAKEVLLSAGQQLLVASRGSSRPVSADIARATSWTQRQLVFESTPLAEVAEEFNRYNSRQMIIRTAELNSFQIDGVFSSTDPASLIRFLRGRPGVHVTESDSKITIGSD